MESLLKLLLGYEPVIYFLLVIVSIRFFYRIIVIQIRLQKSMFGLEREILLRAQTGALGMLALLILLGGGVYLSAHRLLPEAIRARQQAPVASDGVAIPTTVPSPTPFVQFGVDVSGCVNKRATILKPKPGDTVQGMVDFLISANIEQFAYYSIQLGSPDTADVWMTLFTSNETVTEGPPVSEGAIFVWDSTTMPPGVYHLRLEVKARDNSSPRPCLVPIQVLEMP